MSDWKPGDSSVAVISWVSPSKRHGGTVLAFRVSDEYDESHWHTETFGVVPDDQVTDVRPLVIIDPEDRAAVERLRDIYDVMVISQNGDPDPRDVSPGERGNALQAALREFATPTPPKPDEPRGLGAVVEDAEGCDWHRTATGRWLREDGLRCTAGGWTHVEAVRVLSEGVTP